jgi:hypothetical protein
MRAQGKDKVKGYHSPKPQKKNRNSCACDRKQIQKRGSNVGLTKGNRNVRIDEARPKDYMRYKNLLGSMAL